MILLLVLIVTKVTTRWWSYKLPVPRLWRPTEILLASNQEFARVAHTWHVWEVPWKEMFSQVKSYKFSKTIKTGTIFQAKITISCNYPHNSSRILQIWNIKTRNLLQSALTPSVKVRALWIIPGSSIKVKGTVRGTSLWFSRPRCRWVLKLPSTVQFKEAWDNDTWSHLPSTTVSKAQVKYYWATVL